MASNYKRVPIFYFFYHKFPPLELFSMSLRQAQRPCFYRLDKPFESLTPQFDPKTPHFDKLSASSSQRLKGINLIFVFYQKVAPTELIGNRFSDFYKQFTLMELFSMSLRQAQRPCFYRLDKPFESLIMQFDPSTMHKDRKNGY